MNSNHRHGLAALFALAVLCVFLTACQAQEPTPSLTESAPPTPSSTATTNQQTRQEQVTTAAVFGDNTVDTSSPKTTVSTGVDTTASSTAKSTSAKMSDKTTASAVVTTTTTDTTNITTKTTTQVRPLADQYLWYIQLSGQQQAEYMSTFSSVPEFVRWYQEAKAAYQAEHPEIELGPDTVVGNP